MATQVDLKIGLNLEIGSVPVSMEVDVQTGPQATVYTFGGSVQDAVIPLKEFISYVGQQFGVAAELPPELALEAEIDYLAGQVIYTKPASGTTTTTELGVASKFELTVGSSHFAFTFYADVISTSPAPAGGNPYVVGASVDLQLDFSSLPLVGTIPGFDDLTLTNVGFSYTNLQPTTGTPVTFHIPQVAASTNPLYTRSDPNARNAKSYAITSTGGQQKFSLTSGGFALTAGFTQKSTGTALQNFALPMQLPATTPPAKNAPPASFYSGKTSPPASSVHWIDVNRTFGPVNLQKIGLNYSGGEATFGFSAGFAMGGFSLGLQGLTITFPLPLPGQPAGSSVDFGLDGLSLDIKEGGFEFGGAFLRTVTDGVTAYFGEILVQAAQFGFKAMGGYTPAHTADDTNIPASLFLYASLNVPLGGPPFLYVTGLAGGFGINNALILPTLDELPTYILLPHNAPQQSSSAQGTIAAVLPQMQKYFLDRPGEYWAAAGIQFTSFQMINAFALVTVSFGVDFQLGLLGSASMVFPTGAPEPIAYIEIDMLAQFTPASGLLAVEGKLSPASYLFGSFCQLTGGFAFYLWFAGDHQGDFVVTIGGYNPAYVPPDYYPRVPRLGINFSLGGIQITGGAYFALTPAMFMAGGSLTALWQVPGIKAWFTAGADFLIAWAPFHYEADVYVNVGCSVNLGLFTLNLHVGADLFLWGPSFGGRADVDLDVVTFSIAFGAPKAAPAPVGWTAFKTSFLPADTATSSQPAPKTMALFAAYDAPAGVAAEAPASTTNVVKGSVGEGLLGSAVEGYDWLVDPDHFAILASSTIPINQPRWGTGASTTIALSNDPAAYNVLPVDVSAGPWLELPAEETPFDATHVWNPTVSIRPMGQNDVQSIFTLSLVKRGQDNTYSDWVTSVAVEPVLNEASAALWLQAMETPSPNDPSFAPGVLTGWVIAPIPRDPDTVSAVPLLELIYTQGNETSFTDGAAAVSTTYTVASTEAGAQLDITVGGAATESLPNSDYLLASLENTWVVQQRAAVLTALQGAGFSTYAPDEVDLTILARQTALTDWPEVMLLGDALPA
jgi:hypothetical protein